MDPGPQCQALTDIPHSPLTTELVAVLLEQLLRIDPRACERPAAEVVDEQVMRHGQLEAGPACSLGQVIVIEESQPEPLIEPANGLEDSPLH